MKLASFDIFDTVLIRKCGKPENIFYLLAHHLYPADESKRENFIQWRRRAESQVARCKKREETTITDLYTLNGEENFSEYTRTQLIEAEKKVESENLIANPAVKSIIEKCRAEGKTVCFISDMYLDSEFLSRVLKREGCLVGNEKVYVSCEEGARKSTGALFDKVRSYLNLTHWEHYGDHPVSDVKRAKEKGIKATLVNTAFTESEKFLSQRNRRFSYELSCLAGLQRAARITNGNNAYSAIAADFVAPAYIPYVQFVLEKAKELGIKRLYFLSRDSYILQKIAEQTQVEHASIELKYLFVSRKALLLPYLQEPTAAKFLAVQDKQTLVGKYVEELLGLLGTSSDELKEKFFTEFEYHRITSKQQEEDFLCKIFGEKSNFHNHLKKIATEKRELLNAYFTQEGLFDDSEKAMVDVGWLGTTRLMINSTLREEGHKEIPFFYYGIREDVFPCKYGKYFSYNRIEASNTELTFVVEDYFSASPYKTTIGYKQKGSDVIADTAGDKMQNKITINNRVVTQWIAKELKELPGNTSRILWLWGDLSLKSSLSQIQQFDLSPFIDCDICKKLNFAKLVNVIILGGRESLYDKGSLVLSVPKKSFNFVSKIHNFTRYMRHFIATRLKR